MASQDFAEQRLRDTFSQTLEEMNANIRRLKKQIKSGGATPTQMDQLQQLEDRLRRDLKDFKKLRR
jgi:hypothetical protein